MRTPILVALVVVTCGCGSQADPRPTDARNPTGAHDGTSKLLLIRPDLEETPHLHNLLQLTDRLYSGGDPDGEEAFAELAKLGVKVVVSVDGAKPDVEAAKKHGLRYVHIPFGYDGVTDEAGLALARVVRETEAVGDTVYFHCHHGKHRGPAAAAVACIAANAADNAAAEQILVAAGTSRDYAGLWRDVAAYTPPPAGADLPELVEVAQVDSLVTAMSNLDRTFDNLTLLQQADWQPPIDHPDLAAAQEALMAKETLHEIGRTLAEGYDEQFHISLSEAERRATELEHNLSKKSLAAAAQSLRKLDASCKQCHTEYRN